MTRIVQLLSVRLTGLWLTIFCSAFPITTSWAQMGSLDTSFNSSDIGFGNGDGANNSIYTTALQTDGKILIGGSFTTYNGTARVGIARLNSDGTLDNSFSVGSGVNDPVFSVAVQSDGKILIAGHFTNYNGTTTNRIARLNSNGSRDTSFHPGTAANNDVISLKLQSDGKILIAGLFTTINGVSRNRVARLDTNGNLDATFQPGTGASGEVSTIALQGDGKIMISGQGFTLYNGTGRNRIARLNTDGTLDATFDPGSGFSGGAKVNAFLFFDNGNILIGGNFTSYNGTSRSKTALLTSTGSLLSFNPTSSGDVYAMVQQPDKKIVVAGSFNGGFGAAGLCFYCDPGVSFGYKQYQNIIRLDSNLIVDTTTFGTVPAMVGTDARINALLIQGDGKIIAAGEFSNFNRAGKRMIARITTDATLDASFNPGSGANTDVYTMYRQSDGKMLIGGGFSIYNGTITRGVARINTDGSFDTTFNLSTVARSPIHLTGTVIDSSFYPGIGPEYGSSQSGTVLAIGRQSDGKILVGGSFQQFNGVNWGPNSSTLVRLNSNGTVDYSFNPPIDPSTGGIANAPINALLVQSDDKIIIGGNFVATGVSGAKLMRLNTDGTRDTSFAPQTSATGTNNITAMALQPDGKIIIGGDFHITSFGITAHRLARLNTNGTLDTSFHGGSGADGSSLSIVLLSDGKILIGGIFRFYNGVSREHFARLNSDGTLDNSLTSGFSSSHAVESIALQEDGKIVVGGTFSTYSGSSINNLVRVNSNGSRDTSFHPGTGPNSSVYTVAMMDGQLLIGGNFTGYNGTGRNRLARVIACISPSIATCQSNFNATTTSGQCNAVVNYSVTASGSPAASYSYTFSGATSGTGSGTGSGSTFNKGTTNVTVTASNSCGSATCSFSITITDNAAPTPDVTSLSNATGECSVSLTSPTASDNCSGAIAGTTSDPTSYTSQGTYTVHWTYDDGNGNSSSQNQTVIVDDVTAPVPDVATLSNATGECSASVSAPTSSDNCEGTITGTTSDPTSYSAQGTYTVHWTYDDSNGNTSAQNQMVIVDDVTAPTPNITSLSSATGECSVSLTSPTALDNCASTITATTSDPTSYSAQGTYTVHWNYDDGNGNTSSQNQTVIVDDVTAPVPDLASLSTATGECSASVVAPTANDNCVGTITATTSDPTSYSAQGTYTVHWNYDDGNGNTSSKNQTVIVDDVSAPVPDVASLSTSTGECSASVTAPTASDNCAGTITATTSDAMSYSAQGTYTVHWLYSDGNGNSSSQNQTVIVDDFTAPVPNVASLSTSTGECSASVTAPTASDNCAGTITGTTSDPTSYTSQGTYTVHWSYDDSNGNTSSQNQTVIVDDVSAPVPDVASLSTSTGECSASVTAPTASDNCSSVLTGTTSDPTSYSAQGTYTVHWSYDDGNGNTTSQNQTVIVDDITAPVPDVASLSTSTGECSASVTAPTASDNCAGTIMATTSDAMSYAAQGTYTVHWTYDDGNGNTSSQNQTVIVDDVTAPVPDVSSLSNATGDCSVTVTVPTATDNCAGAITGTTSDPTSYTAQGTYTVHWNYNDGDGNTSTQNQTVVVDDNAAPTPHCKNISINLSGSSVSINASQVDDGSEDNCGVGSLSVSPSTFTSSNIGINNVTLTVTDVNGNTATCTAVVTIYSNATCSVTITSVPSSNVYTGGNPNVLYLGYGPQSTQLQTSVVGGTSHTYSWSPSTGLSSTTVASPVFTPTVEGTFTFTVTVTDNNGCTATKSETICVLEIRVPNESNKVYLCYLPPGNTSNVQLLSISINAVPSHIENHTGDHLGECSQSCGSGSGRTYEHNDEMIESSNVSIQPNPFSDGFTIHFHGSADDRAGVEVYNLTGQKVETITNLLANHDWVLGTNYRTGIYFVHFILGEERKVMRVIKID